MLAHTPSGARRGTAGSTTERADEDDESCEAFWPPAPGGVDECHRQKDGRIELRGRREAEHAEAEPVTAADQGGERGDDEQGRPEVEARQDDASERERSERREGDVRVQLSSSVTPTRARVAATSATIPIPQASIRISKSVR